MDKKEANMDMDKFSTSKQTPLTKENYVKIGLFIIKKLNEGTEYNEVKNLVVNEGFPSGYVDGIINIEHIVMSCKTKNMPDEAIITAVTAKGWPKEIVEELIKGIDAQIHHKKN